MSHNRYRIIIRCPKCGEKYILRGSPDKDGKFDTGFKRCVCGNEEKLYMDISPE